MRKLNKIKLAKRKKINAENVSIIFKLFFRRIIWELDHLVIFSYTNNKSRYCQRESLFYTHFVLNFKVLACLDSQWEFRLEDHTSHLGEELRGSGKEGGGKAGSPTSGSVWVHILALWRALESPMAWGAFHVLWDPCMLLPSDRLWHDDYPQAVSKSLSCGP